MWMNTCKSTTVHAQNSYRYNSQEKAASCLLHSKEEMCCQRCLCVCQQDNAGKKASAPNHISQLGEGKWRGRGGEVEQAEPITFWFRFRSVSKTGRQGTGLGEGLYAPSSFCLLRHFPPCMAFSNRFPAKLGVTEAQDRLYIRFE